MTQAQHWHYKWVRRLRPLKSLALAMPLICACDRPNAGAAFSVRDSLGVAIVVNRAPALTTPSSWKISSSPTLVIGAEPEDSTQQLYRVRDAVRSRGGNIVIANAGTGQVRIYDADGQFIRAVGRPGDGPGEFSVFLESIWLLAQDSVVAWDAGKHQMLVFDSSGVFARSFSLAEGLNGIDRLPDGSFVGWSSQVDQNARALGEVWTSEFHYIRHSADGRLLNDLGVHPGMESFTSEWDGSVIKTTRPLGTRAVSVAGPGAFYYGASNSFRVIALAPDGRTIRVIERTQPRPRVTAAIREDYIQERLRVAAPDAQLQAMWESYLRRIDYPEFVPSYRQLLADPDSNLWVREWDVPGNDRVSWSVFSWDGRWITDVHVPRGLQVLEIGAEYVMGVMTDALDVERVAVFRLER